MIKELWHLKAPLEVIGISSPVLAPHILAIRLTGVDQFSVVKRLWRDRNILCTFVGPLDLIRFQFGERTSGGDIRSVVDAMAELLEECSLPKQPEPAPMPVDYNIDPVNSRPVDTMHRSARRARGPRKPGS